MAVRQRYRRQQIAARRAGARWLAVVITLTVFLCLPSRARAECPPDVDPRACAELDACIARIATEPDPDTGAVVGLAREYLIVGDRFRRCALSGYSLAVARADIRVVTTSTPAPCLTAAPLERSFVDSVLVPAGSCALGCGLVASGAAAAVVWGCSR